MFDLISRVGILFGNMIYLPDLPHPPKSVYDHLINLAYDYGRQAIFYAMLASGIWFLYNCWLAGFCAKKLRLAHLTASADSEKEPDTQESASEKDQVQHWRLKAKRAARRQIVALIIGVALFYLWFCANDYDTWGSFWVRICGHRNDFF